MTGSLPTDAAEPALRERALAWRAWLFDHALPLWAERGLNPQGGFFDRLSAAGEPVRDPLRLRVQARQTYAYAEAGRLGWPGDWRSVVLHGLDFLVYRGARADGLMASRFDLDGSVLDGEPDLYDQSFALLGYAAAYGALHDERARDGAHALLRGLQPYKQPTGGYRELSEGAVVLKSNPQMHLLEAVLAWTELDEAPVWRDLAEDLGRLCADRLTERGGVLREFFIDDWRPAPDPLGDRTEPGHHFEWAWLLTRQSERRWDLARELCERAETLGVDRLRGVAMNAIGVEGARLDASARLWPQTERLKAALVMRRFDPRWTVHACEAADSLLVFTRSVEPGLWLDVVEPDGSLRLEPSPASSFYHIVCALSELVKAAGTST